MTLRMVDFGTALKECKEDRIMAVIDCKNHSTISLDDLYFLLMDDPEPAADPDPRDPTASAAIEAVEPPKQKRPVRKIDNIEECKALRDAGWTLKQIADKYEVSPQTVANNLNRLDFLERHAKRKEQPAPAPEAKEPEKPTETKKQGMSREAFLDAMQEKRGEL